MDNANLRLGFDFKPIYPHFRGEVESRLKTNFLHLHA